MIAAKVVTVRFLKPKKRAIWGDQNFQNALKHLVFVSTNAPKWKKNVFIYIIDFRLFRFLNSEDPVNMYIIDQIFRINKV
jgi:hypothetical protein